ncbi:uncharacterized protein [Rutidosis leptorrhynchoides]|uniref:uncharacterized protein n=1 Tax=Rutidosis leptorrhynchoides TaxID=125765 RepID=UPI003A99752D
MLEAKFSDEEIWDAIKNCDPSKAPCPDDFNLKFYKKFLWLIKDDLKAALDWFWSKESISKGCNLSFMTLIPKKTTPMNQGDYRLISLIGSNYKIIAKILSKRFQRVIHKIIGVEQSAFMKGQYILDGILIANELIDETKRHKKKCLKFKVDFKKAFDSVNWEFPFKFLERMRFSSRWRNWIRSCISSTSISILVNGSPTDEFQLHRGIRQVEDLARSFGYLVGNLPYHYLGLPIEKKMNNIRDWEPFIDKFHSRLADWKAKSMSFGGHLTLIKSVLSSLPMYAFSLFHAPTCIINKLESLCRKFFWEGSRDNSKIFWVNWDNILLPYEGRGLNIGSFKANNLALLEKWWWRFHGEKNTLWVKIISSIYGRDRSLGSLNFNYDSGMGSVWRNICKSGLYIDNFGISFINSFTNVVCKGDNTLFS